MLQIIIISFFSGVLSVLAPCVLPVLPVIFGSNLDDNSKYKPLRIILSMLLCIFIFTFLLKVSTSLIDIPPSVRNWISGTIIGLYGLTLLFPKQRDIVQSKIPHGSLSNQQSGLRGDFLIGASLGPIFATCSPTYALLLGTVLPASNTLGIIGLLVYLLGFGGFLYVLVLGGRGLIKKFYHLADSTGLFKKFLGAVLIITSLLIVSGVMKNLESKLIQYVPDIGKVEQKLIEKIDIGRFEGNKTDEDIEIEIESEQEATKQFSGGLYTGYDENLIKQLTGNIVLFFHADWCPTCQEIEKNIDEQGLPAGLTILKVDFDTARDLRKKYLVLSQSSFVQIKSDGAAIKKRIGGLKVQDIMDEINQKPNSQVKKTGSNQTAVAYFAGGCFWCIEAGFEGQVGVREAINGYIGGDQSTATYEQVSSGRTPHREGVQVLYDPALISYEELLRVYRKLVDPTDSGGQFADRGSQYRTAIYYSGSQEQVIVEKSKKQLEDSGKFDQPIVVELLPNMSFYPAEEYHQDYYKKNNEQYDRYEKGSGRERFIDENWKNDIGTFASTGSNDEPRKLSQEQVNQNIKNLTSEQKDILYNAGTERPFDNAYRDNHAEGIYVDVIDGTPLFSSTDKFDSGTGRPSFTRPISESLVADQTDNSLPIERTEIKSTSTSGHLGHVFDDGPLDKGGKRYCINSATLKFIPRDQMQQLGYGKYLELFK